MGVLCDNKVINIGGIVFFFLDSAKDIYLYFGL